MLSRDVGKSSSRSTSMFSLDPATVGKSGYREIFQVGEALDGQPLIDHQHPHDLFMQLAARLADSVTDTTGSPSPADPPASRLSVPSPSCIARRPLRIRLRRWPSHFDSTHIAFGVVTAAVDHGPCDQESVFNGREPDENRWDFDFGALDSVSGRLVQADDRRWEFQVSTGHLVDPEELEPGNITRTTASGSWFNKAALTSPPSPGVGNQRGPRPPRQRCLARRRGGGANSIFTRLEVRPLEPRAVDRRVLSCPSLVHCIGLDEQRGDPVAAMTLGGTRDMVTWRGLEGASRRAG